MVKLNKYQVATSSFVTVLALIGSVENIYADVSIHDMAGSGCVVPEEVPVLNTANIILNSTDIESHGKVTKGTTVEHTLDIDYDFTDTISPSNLCQGIYDITLDVGEYDEAAYGALSTYSTTEGIAINTRDFAYNTGLITSANAFGTVTISLVVDVTSTSELPSDFYYSFPIQIKATAALATVTIDDVPTGGG